MNRTLVKIIKRKNGQAAAGAPIEAEPTRSVAAKGNKEKIERSSRRRIEDTVTMWIHERRENKSSEDVSAFRKLFGEERLACKTA